MVEARLKRFGLSIRAGHDFDLINPEDDPRYRSYVQDYIDAAGRSGITPDAARTLVRTNNTVIAALAVLRGEADAMICGVEGRYLSHLRRIREIIGFAPGMQRIRSAGAGDHVARARSSSPTRMCGPIRRPRSSPRSRRCRPSTSSASA